MISGTTGQSFVHGNQIWIDGIRKLIFNIMNIQIFNRSTYDKAFHTLIIGNRNKINIQLLQGLVFELPETEFQHRIRLIVFH